MLHNTTAKPLREMLPHLALERRELFDPYLSVHSDQAGAALKNRAHVAVFLPMRGRRYLFEGLYQVKGWQMTPTREIYSNPAFREISTMYGDSASDPIQNIERRAEQDVFDLEPKETMADLRGRVVVESPGGRNYVRVAANTPLEVVELSEAHQLISPPPEWRDFIVSGAFLRAIPRTWADVLRQWRGIYLMTDQSDGMRYVGSAYGQQNLFGRWEEHVRGECGVTVELVRRDPLNFQFSILERVSPDATIEDITSLEHTWIRRLDTIQHGLNT